MHQAGHSKPVLWDNPEGWSGEGEGMVVHDGGTRVDLWLIHVDVWQKPLQYCKVIRHPTPVLLPGKPHGQRSLVGCSPWGR